MSNLENDVKQEEQNNYKVLNFNKEDKRQIFLGKSFDKKYTTATSFRNKVEVIDINKPSLQALNNFIIKLIAIKESLNYEKNIHLRKSRVTQKKIQINTRIELLKYAIRTIGNIKFIKRLLRVKI